MSKKVWFFLALIIVLAGVLRFYKLGQVPAGFVNDEAVFGYNAYSLLETGKDEFGKNWPLMFRSFGDNKLPVYTYLTIPFVKFLGLTELAVRLPVALLGTATVFLTFWLVRELGGLAKMSEKIHLVALFSALCLAILPWHIHFSRAAFEAGIGLFLITLGTWLFLIFCRKNQWPYLFISLVAFGVSILSYHSPRVFVPLWLLVLTVWAFKKTSKAQLASFLVAGIFLVGGPWFMLLVSQGGLSRVESISVFNPQNDVMIRLNQKYTEGKEMPLLLIRALHNKAESYGREIVSRYLDHFDFDYLFFSGDLLRQRYRTPDAGQLLWIMLPFFLIGIYATVRKGPWLILWWLVLAPIPAALTFETPSSVRALLMVVPLAAIVGLGMVETINFINLKLPKLRVIPIGFISLVFIYSFAYYLDGYFIHSPVHEPYEWQYGYKELVSMVNQLKDDYDRVEITDKRGTPYIFFLFYNQYPPQKWQAQVDEAVEAAKAFNFIAIRKMDNLYFVDETCPAKNPRENVLYVCTQEDHPAKLIKKGIVEIVKTIPYQDGQPAFVLMRQVPGTEVPENLDDEEL